MIRTKADQDNNHGTGPLMLRAMRSSIGRESTTFGFSILITVSFGVMQSLQGSPVIAEIFLVAGGAVLSFTILEGFISCGFMRPMPQHRTEVQALGTSLNLLSVVVGMGVVLLTGTVLPGMFAWVLAPFSGSVAYLVLERAEAGRRDGLDLGFLLQRLQTVPDPYATVEHERHLDRVQVVDQAVARKSRTTVGPPPMRTSRPSAAARAMFSATAGAASRK